MKFKSDLHKGLIRVPALIEGPSRSVVVNLALDTGASATVVGWDPVVDAGYDPAAVHERLQLTTGSGIEYVPAISVSSIEALNVVKKDFRIVCHTMPPTSRVDGILGLDFLDDQRLIIDFRVGEIEID